MGNRVRRRAFAIVSFLVLAVTTALLGLWVNAPAAGVIALFAAFSFTISAAAGLCAVYPSEMFPTAVRASGVGLVTALSRIGAAAGTFLLPMAIDTVGVHGTTLMVAGLLTAGLLASIVWAPETKTIALGEAREHVPGQASPSP
ncbi:MFS transporter [Streptomyces javensis]|uniref:MFS transporter n=1 Tax=Streptomyces javensis TaxID=114698 RepID=UPI0031E08EBC